jgi:predicted dinucleotide-binding enzyme
MSIPKLPRKPFSAPDLGIFGTGRMGLRLAAMFARAGRRVVLASRDPGRARALASSLAIPGLSGGSHAEAFTAPALLPAIFVRDGLFAFADAHRAAFAGKLVVDIANPFNADYSDFTTPWDTSAAELLQARLPGARVVGAFKNVFAEVFDAPDFDGLRSDVLVVGDDDEAKQAFLELAADTPFRYLDAGGLVHARTIERLTLLTGRLGRQIGSYPRMNWRLLGAPVATATSAAA